MKKNKKLALGIALAMAMTTLTSTTYTPANTLLIAPNPSVTKENSATVGTEDSSKKITIINKGQKPIVITTPKPTVKPLEPKVTKIPSKPTKPIIPIATKAPNKPIITTKPEVTSNPKSIATNTPKPMATSTPVPTVTSTPKPTATSTPVPTVTSAPRFTNIIDKTNTVMGTQCFTSEEEATRYFFEMALNGYYKFGIMAEDLSMLHTKEEYMELYPVILELEMEDVIHYNNGYYLAFNNVRLCQIDAEEMYAVETGDTSFLNEKEVKAYEKLLSITEELKLEGKTDIDKIVAIHDYLVLNTAYDSNFHPDSHYVEGTLNNNLAVCSGYASAFRLLLMLQDIPCEYVWSEKGNHGWNLVQLDGKWYHIDVTWDDPVPDEKGRLLYTHFMMTDKEVATLDNHQDWECECGDESSHNCDSDSYRIYPYKDYVCSTKSEAVKLIQAQANNDKIIIVYPLASSLTEDSLLHLVMDTLHWNSISWSPSKNLGFSYQVLIVNN